MFRRARLVCPTGSQISLKSKTSECSLQTSDTPLTLHTDQSSTLSVPTAPGRRLAHSQKSDSFALFSTSDDKPSKQDTLGLHIVHDVKDPCCDIVFVHGLGGSAWKTWSWERNIANFWPSWLPEDVDLVESRILTFGYNAMFKGAATNLDIIDFAKDLLLHLHTARDLNAQDRPTIFVAHSMGGLVVKKACMLGKHDKLFSRLISNVMGIMFLATPHRGAQHAKTLNNILAAAPFGAPPKAYVADLERNSSAIEDINESFRQHCQELSLVSLYETLRTNLGVTKALIVEKDSAVLGYPNEVSASMDADHHSICKFSGRSDPNFLKLKGILQSWVSRHNETSQNSRFRSKDTNRTDVKELQTILGTANNRYAEDTLASLRAAQTSESGMWLSRRKNFDAWIESQPPLLCPQFFWLVGPPGTGKSVLSAWVVEQFQARGQSVQYYFFNQADKSRRSCLSCLLSIATQLAQQSEAVQSALLTLHKKTGMSFATGNPTFQQVWDRIFSALIFKTSFAKPLIWVLDGVDEADMPSLLLTHIAKMRPTSGIKVYFSSRPLQGISLFESSQIVLHHLQDSDTANDILTFARTAIQQVIPDDSALQESVVGQIIRNAGGSFLWLKLAVEALQERWHTQEDIQAAINEVPMGMVAMYEKMIASIKAQTKRNRDLATRILTWVACCWRPLLLDELREALEAEFGVFTNLEATIQQICGHFVTISKDTTNPPRLSLIHTTAREFLLNGDDELPAFVDSKQGHLHIATTCLAYLSDDRWREHQTRSSSSTRHRCHLLEYAAFHWAYHVSRASIESSELLDAVNAFFSDHCLSWIETIALFGRLQYVSNSATYLKLYMKRVTRKSSIGDEKLSLSLSERQEMIECLQAWTTDLIRVVGKFGANLLRNPAAIHNNVPPFCPKNSMIGKTFGTPRQNSTSVEGLSSHDWDDCLASVTVEGNEDISQVVASEATFITLASASGTMTVWNAETCEKQRTLRQEEYVIMIALNTTGTLLGTAGFETFGIWDVSSGTRTHNFLKNTDAMVRDITFGLDDTELLVGLDDRTILFYNLETEKQRETFRAQIPDDDSTYYGCPAKIAISPELGKVAMIWRGRSPLVWDLNRQVTLRPRRCIAKDEMHSIMNPEQIRWQPETGSLMVLCHSTTLVEWRVSDDEVIEHSHVHARDISVSADGNFLLTRDSHGTISIWTFPRLNLVYSLLNNNDPSTDMVPSPSCQRFYDIRGSVCNVWEPDVLVRPDDQDLEDHASSGGSFAAAEPVISSAGNNQTLITALAVGSSAKYFCCGREDGSVVINDAGTGRRLRKVYSHGSSADVVVLAWSESGKYMVSCDEFGHVIAKRLKEKEEGKWAVFPLFETRLEDLAQQLLFSHDEEFLLVSTPSEDRVWDLKAKKEVHHRDWGPRQGRRWLQHPVLGDSLIWVDAKVLRVFKWTTFEQARAVQIESNLAIPGYKVAKSAKLTRSVSRSRSPSPMGGRRRAVNWAISVSNGADCLLVYATCPEDNMSISNVAGSHSGLEIEVLDMKDMDFHQSERQDRMFLSPDQDKPKAIRPNLSNLGSLTERIKLLVGSHGSGLAFLDHDGWVWTWDVTEATKEGRAPPAYSSVAFYNNSRASGEQHGEENASWLTRHFFTPKDWLNTNTSHLTVMNSRGELFCPKYGDVVVVKGGMRI